MLHRREMMGWLTVAMLFTGSPALSGATPEFQGSRAVAQIEVGPTRVDWLPNAGDYERLILTVAGPGDLYVRQEFGPGQTPYLDILGTQGDHLPDGIYAYELRVVPRNAVPQELRKEQTSERPRVQSGYLSIREERFVNPESPRGKPSGEGKPLSGSSLPNVGTKVITNGWECIGTGCMSGDDDVPVLKLKGATVRIKFEDLWDGYSYARDYALQANDSLGGSDRFFLWDMDANTTPLSIAGGAPDHSLSVGSNGNLGLGTSTPATRLDVKASVAGQAAARFQSSSSTGYSGIEYLDNGGNVDLFFGVDNAASTTRLNSVNNNPILLMTNSAERMRITSGGNVGVGTSTPDARLDVEAADSVEIRMSLTGSNVWQLINNYPGFGIQLAGTGFRAVNVDGGGNMQLYGTLTQGSSRDLKTDFVSLDPQDVLAKVKALPVSTWRYKLDGPEVRHVGPTAEDFHKAFGLGGDDKRIAPSDQAGVALVAVQGLTQELETLRRKNADLEERLAALEALLSALRPQE